VQTRLCQAAERVPFEGARAPTAHVAQVIFFEEENFLSSSFSGVAK
jgi:hypothetical protein